jgi:hypothetical protein
LLPLPSFLCFFFGSHLLPSPLFSCFYFGGKLNNVINDTNFFPPPPLKVAQLLSNLFITVIGNNEGFVFYFLLRVPWLSSNLTNFVDNNGFWMF